MHFKITKKHITRISIITGILIIIYLLYGFFYNPLTLTNYTISNDKIPSGFDGFKIVQVADLHSANFGDEQDELIDMVQSCDPDIIVLTGDTLDRSDTTLTNVENLFKGIHELCPVYYINGNHELFSLETSQSLQNLCKEYNIFNLNNSSDIIYNEDESQHIYIHGLDFDSNFWLDSEQLKSPTDSYSILLNHDATIFNDVAYFLNDDLVISGHTHGGIIRLPFIGGLINTDQTFFSEFDNGLYYYNSSTLVSCRGLGNNSIIPRFNNHPEVVCITLASE